jgi:hypothetical protein
VIASAWATAFIASVSSESSLYPVLRSTSMASDTSFSSGKPRPGGGSSNGPMRRTKSRSYELHVGRTERLAEGAQRRREARHVPVAEREQETGERDPLHEVDLSDPPGVEERQAAGRELDDDVARMGVRVEEAVDDRTRARRR